MRAVGSRLIFAEPGSYTVALLDASRRLVGATTHWVAGPGLAVAPGTIEIVLDASATSRARWPAR